MGEADDLARRAFSRLGARGENQAIVFLYVLLKHSNLEEQALY